MRVVLFLLILLCTFPSCSCNNFIISPDEIYTPVATFETFKLCIKNKEEKLWKAYNLLAPETRKKYSYDEFAYALKKHDYAETFCELIVGSEIIGESNLQNHKVLQIKFEDIELNLKFVQQYNETTKSNNWFIDFDFDKDLPQVKYSNDPELEPHNVFELYKRSLSEGIFWNAYLFIKPPKEKVLPTYRLFYRALTKTEKGRLYLENLKNSEVISCKMSIIGDLPYAVIETKWGNGIKKFALAKPEEFWVVIFTFENALGINYQEVESLK